jgi:chromosome partitioning protein
MNRRTRYAVYRRHSTTEDAVPVVSLQNQKGGVAKTTTTWNIAGSLAAMGRRVLLLDNDPQSSLTQGAWGPTATRSLDPSATIAACYRGERPFPDAVIHPSGVDGVDLVPGSGAATSYNLPDPHLLDEDAQTCLRSLLEECRDRYDLVLIDNPPNLHLCSWAAMVASDYLLVPVQPEDYGAQGLADVHRSLSLVRAAGHPIALLGYVLTLVQARRSVHQAYEQRLRALYGDAVLAARVPHAVDFVEAIAQRLPVAKYKPRGASAKAIKALAEEVLARIETRTQDRTEAA